MAWLNVSDPFYRFRDLFCDLGVEDGLLDVPEISMNDVSDADEEEGKATLDLDDIKPAELEYTLYDQAYMAPGTTWNMRWERIDEADYFKMAGWVPADPQPPMHPSVEFHLYGEHDHQFTGVHRGDGWWKWRCSRCWHHTHRRCDE